MSVKVTIDTAKLDSKLRNISNIDPSMLLERACLVVENEAKINCPVDTGQLRSSITHEVHDQVGEVGTNVEYAPYVEYGTGLFAADGNGRQTPWVYPDAEGQFHYTVGQHPQPFLEPALLNNIETIYEVIGEAIREELSNA